MRATNGHIRQLNFRDHSVADNVVDLSFYRRWRLLRRPLGVILPSLKRVDIEDTESYKDYLDRMKINAMAFVALALLVLIGIGLMNGIVQVPHHLV
jgi:hypothetical protein